MPAVATVNRPGGWTVQGLDGSILGMPGGQPFKLLAIPPAGCFLVGIARPLAFLYSGNLGCSMASPLNVSALEALAS
jgi:hypothetical protein